MPEPTCLQCYSTGASIYWASCVQGFHGAQRDEYTPPGAMQLFSQRQKGQLDVYGLWGVLRGQLLTDDSFVFNKVLNRIKESIQHLPDATEEDEEALLRVKVSSQQ